jgi:autotransporter adhesin
LQTQVDTNRDAIERNARGIAMVAAMTHSTVLPGMTHALDVSAAHFEGETGMAISYSRLIKDGVQINFGAASTTDFEESVVRAGIGYQW